MSNARLPVILNVDDSDDARTTLNWFLERGGYEVWEASTGRAALNQVSRRPDLVILDVVLPDIDGYEVCGRIKADPATALTPVLMVSGYAVDSGSRVQGLDGGADAFLTKPVEPELLLAQIKALLRVRRAELNLQASERRLRTILENSFDAITLVGPDGLFREVSPAITRILGYQANDLIGRDERDFLHSDDRPASDQDSTLHLKAPGTLRTRTMRMRHRDGSWRWVEARRSNLLHDPAVAAIVVNFRDVTDEYQTQEAQSRLAAIVESTADAVVSTDRYGDILTWNPAAERLYGYAAEEVVGRSIAMFSPPELQADTERVLVRLADGEYVPPYETIRVRKDGSRFQVAVTPSVIRLPGGRVVALAAIYRDVTAMKLAEAALREARAAAESGLARMNAIVASMVDGLVVSNGDGNMIDWNPAAMRLHGFENLDEVRRPVSELTAFFELSLPGGPPLPLEDWPLSRLLRGEPVCDYELWVRRQDIGREWVIAYNGSVVRGTDGSIELAVLILHDVTARRRAESELQRTADLLRAVADGTTDAIFVKDSDGRYLFANNAAARYAGQTALQMVGMYDADLFPPDEARRIVERDRRVMASAQADTEEEDYTVAGTARTFLTSKAPYRNAPGEVLGVIGIARDITARKLADRELLFRDRAMQVVSQGILITDPNLPDNPIVYASPGFERLTGYRADEAAGRNCRFLQGPNTDPVAVAEVREAVREQRECAVELINYRKDGTPFWNALRITPVRDGDRVTHFVGVQVDVTDRRKLEEQYRQSQKMEAVGRLAGGIAHDFNNLLTVINGYGDIVLDALPAEHTARELVGEMTRAGERAAGLTRQLLAFSRQAVVAPRVLDLNVIIADMERLLRRVIGEDIDFYVRLQPDLGAVRVDPGHVEQVVMNLIVNARDALPAGGKLTVGTKNVELGEDYTRVHPLARPGEYVLLSVSDTGSGMTPEVAARVFEPFFTTKGPGKGTGLGLATVHGIVTQAGGHVGVYSEYGLGSTFKVYLPRVEFQAASGPARLGFVAPALGTETVLLVEDEDAVRGLATHVLQSKGYTVIAAATAEEAIRLVVDEEQSFDLLVTDVVLPGVSGRQLAERLLARQPRLKVLYLSGYTDDAIVRHGVLEDQVNFLQKPFTAGTLARKVRDVLDGTRSEPPK